MTNPDEAWPFPIDPENGMLLGPTGCHCEDDEKPSAMYYGQLDLCGCGSPRCVHKLMVDCAKTFEDDLMYDPMLGRVNGIEQIVKDRPEIVAEFIAHFLNQKDILEHGGSVYSSWLTERGKQFIEIGPMIDQTAYLVLQ